MKMNLEKLYYMVMEQFENTQEYHKVRLKCWEKRNGNLREMGLTPKSFPLYVDELEGRDAYNFAKAYERSEHGERTIGDFCRILGIDQQKLYGIVKGINKWHEKSQWQYCFPFNERNSEAIMGYMQA